MVPDDELAQIINSGLRQGVTVEDFQKCVGGDDSLGRYIAGGVQNRGYTKPVMVETLEDSLNLKIGMVVVSNAGTIGCKVGESSGVLFGLSMRFNWANLELPLTILAE